MSRRFQVCASGRTGASNTREDALSSRGGGSAIYAATTPTLGQMWPWKQYDEVVRLDSGPLL